MVMMMMMMTIDEIPPHSNALTNDIHSSFIYDKITQSYIMHI